MAWYMSQAVPETFTTSIINAYRNGMASVGGRADATDQGVLNALEAGLVTTAEGAFRLGASDGVGSRPAEIISVLPTVDPNVGMPIIINPPTGSWGDPGQPTAGPAAFGGTGAGTGFGGLWPSWATVPQIGSGLISLPGGSPGGTTGGGGLNTPLPDWADWLINTGLDFAQTRLPMPGGGGAQPPRPPIALPPAGGTTVPRAPIPITIGGRTRTISARQAAAIAAAAAALGIGVQEYIERFGLPAARRRMNVLNPKALSRALRRADGFACFAKRIINVTDRKKSGFKQRPRRCGRKKCA